MLESGNQNESKVLVTGATGFIGSKLVRRLVEHGYRVKTFGRSSLPANQFADLNIEHYGGDITNPEQVSSAVHGCDVIFHLAGLFLMQKRMCSANSASMFWAHATYSKPLRKPMSKE